jgi:hypothetical protein
VDGDADGDAPDGKHSCVMQTEYFRYLLSDDTVTIFRNI